MGGPSKKSEADAVSKEEIWELEAMAEGLCSELAVTYKPVFAKHEYELVLEVFRIDYDLCTKKGIIKKLTKDDVFELGYYSGIDITVNTADGELAEADKRPLARNITLWGSYKSFFKKRHIMNSASRDELRELIESTLASYMTGLGLDNTAG